MKFQKYEMIIMYYQNTEDIFSIEFYNNNENLNAPGDFPAQIYFYQSGNIERMIWFEDGNMHRNNDRPANIGFKDTEALEILDASWHQHGMEHREGDLPSSILINPTDGRVCGLGFNRHGVGRDSEGLPGYVWINPDGTTENEDGEPIECDLSRFQGELPRPPPAARPPFLAFD